ncbi:DUF6329 domain-containing protein [Christensenellaceae bacterium OttesenSCG-928-L17]|nr:DUF6329 domain-containing protein [Christensenellaceae bacterium OttesenSCG-928-L17]
MIETKAVFRRKDPKIEATNCVVEKVIRLGGDEFDRFSHNLLREWDFLRDNPIDTVVDEKGRQHCLLVVGEGRRDGILVNTEGGSYARYTALLPNAGDTLPVLRYPALLDLNTKLERLADYISGQAADAACIGKHAALDLEDLEARFGIPLGESILDTVLDMFSTNHPVHPSIEGQSPPDEKPSVLEQIREARKNPAPPSPKKEADKSVEPAL